VSRAEDRATQGWGSVQKGSSPADTAKAGMPLPLPPARGADCDAAHASGPSALPTLLPRKRASHLYPVLRLISKRRQTSAMLHSSLLYSSMNRKRSSADVSLPTRTLLIGRSVENRYSLWQIKLLLITPTDSLPIKSDCYSKRGAYACPPTAGLFHVFTAFLGYNEKRWPHLQILAVEGSRVRRVLPSFLKSARRSWKVRGSAFPLAIPCNFLQTRCRARAAKELLICCTKHRNPRPACSHAG
jgi:hypothetical protein